MPIDESLLKRSEEDFISNRDFNLRNSVRNGMGSNPDRVAEAIPLAQENGIPLGTAERNLEQIKQKIDYSKINFDGMHNGLKDYLGVPENAMISHDDIGYLEKVTSAFGHGVQIGAESLPEMTQETFEAVGYASGMSDKGSEAVAMPEARTGGTQPYYKDMWEAMDEGENVIESAGNLLVSGLEYAGQGLTSSAPSLVLGLGGAALGAATPVPGGTVIGGATGAFVGSSSQTIGEFKSSLEAAAAEYNKNPENENKITYENLGRTSLAWGTALALPDTVLPAKIGGRIVKSIAGRSIKDQAIDAMIDVAKNTALKNIAKGAGIEAVTEGIQETGKIVGVSQAVDSEIYTEENVKEVVNAMFAGMSGGIAMSSFGEAATGAIDVTKNLAQTNKSRQYLQNMRENISDAGGKLLQRSPKKMQEFLYSMDKADLYVEGEAMTTFYQSMSPEQQEALDRAIPDLQESLLAASANNGVVSMKRADYYTYIQPIENSETLDDYTRLVAEHYSVEEMRYVDETLETIAEEAIALMEEGTIGEETEKSFLDQLQQGLGDRKFASGRLDIAQEIAKNPRAFVETMIERVGDNEQAQEIIKRLVGEIKVMREIPDLPAINTVDQQDFVIDALRSRTEARAKADEKAAGADVDLLGKKSKQKTKAAPTPIISWIGKLGGIRPTGKVATELLAMDISPKSHKRLFKAKGVGSLDNIPASEFNSGIGAELNLVAEEDGNGYVDQAWLLEQIRNESFGEGALNEAQRFAADNAAYLDQLELAVEMSGGDITMDNAALKALLDEYQKSFEGGEGALYQDGVGTLAVRHNLNAGAVLHAEKIGGIPVPSIAISRAEDPFDSFGEITLIGNKDLIDPKKSRKNKVFGADIYSPRYPTVDYKISRKDFDSVISDLEKDVDPTQLYDLERLDQNIQSRGIEGIVSNKAVQYAYLKSVGKSPRITYKKKRKSMVETHPSFKKFVGLDYLALRHDKEFKNIVVDYLNDKFDGRAEMFIENGEPNDNITLDYAREVAQYKPQKDKLVDGVSLSQKITNRIGKESGYEQWVKDTFYYVIKDERIFDGYTPSGNRKYLPHNLQTVVKILSRDLRDGEGFNYGLPSVRAKFAKSFKSVQNIKYNEDLLVSKEGFEKVKEEVGDEFDSVMESLREYSAYGKGFGFGDIFSEHMKEIADSGNVKSVIDEYYNDVPDTIVEKVGDFLSKLESMPTEYFEAKIQRSVDLSEFSAALVPNGAKYNPAVKVLKKHGVKITRYDSKSDKSKQGALEKNSDLFFQKDQGSPLGSIQYYQDTEGFNRAVIRIFEGENLSTVMHELGHLYWKTLTDIAALDNAPEQIVQDVAIMRESVGAKDGATLSVDQEEKIADGFLAYLRTGAAPSVGLQSAFQRMKSWITRLYQGYKDSLPKINSKVSGVFDRMLATDQEIEQVRNTGLFKMDEALLGLLTKQQARAAQKKYDKFIETAKEIHLKKALRQLERKDKKFYREERAAIVERVTAEIEQERVYYTIDQIKQAGGLSAKAIKTLFGGKEVLPYLSGHGGLVKKGGVHPDRVADTTSYHSGYDMIMDIVNSKPQKERVAEVADQEMLDRYGDMMLDGTLADEAVAAAHNASRADILALELKETAKLAQLPGVSKASIEAIAHKIIGAQRVGKITPYNYLRAENKSSFLYGKAIGQKDYAKAAQHKAQQLLNHYLYKEAIEAKETVSKTLKSWKRFSKTDKKLMKSKALSGDYVYAIRAILSRHGIGRGDYDLMGWFNQLKDQDENLAITLADVINRNISDAKPYNEMSYDAFIGLKDDVTGIIDNGRDVMNMEIDGKRAKLTEVIDSAVESIEEHNDIKDDKKAYRTYSGDAKDLIEGYDKEITRMEYILKAIDGNEVNGTLANLFMNPLAKAEQHERELTTEVTQKLEHIINGTTAQKPAESKAAYKKRKKESLAAGKERLSRWNDKVYDTRLDMGFRVKNIITIALNMGNESNLEKLLDGYEWEYADVKALVERYLTKEDMDVVQQIWNLMEDLRPQIELAHKKATGFPMQIIEIQELDTKWGTYKGGYFPIVYDPKKSKVGSDVAANAALTQQNSFMIPSVNRGMTKERTKFSAPLNLDFESITNNHLKKTIHLISHGDAVRDLNRIILNKKFQKAIVDYAGMGTYKQFMPWLQSVASDSVYSAPTDFSDKIIRHLRVSTSAMYMVFSTGTAIKQVLGITTTVAAVTRGELSKKNLYKGFAKYVSNPAAVSKFVLDNSYEMSGRISHANTDIAHGMSNVNKRKSTMQKYNEIGFSVIGYAQIYGVDIPTWQAGYEEGIEKYDGNHEKSVQYADALVRQTQGSGQIKDLYKKQRGTELEKSVYSMFGTFMVGVLYPKLRELGLDVRKGHVVRSIITLMPLVVIPAMLEGLMADPPEDDDEFAEWLALKSLLYGSGGVPLVGGATQALVGAYDFALSPVESSINKTIKGIQSGDPDNFAAAVTMFTGLGVYKPYRTLEELIDQVSGEEDINIPELLQLRPDSDR